MESPKSSFVIFLVQQQRNTSCHRFMTSDTSLSSVFIYLFIYLFIYSLSQSPRLSCCNTHAHTHTHCTLLTNGKKHKMRRSSGRGSVHIHPSKCVCEIVLYRVYAPRCVCVSVTRPELGGGRTGRLRWTDPALRRRSSELQQSLHPWAPPTVVHMTWKGRQSSHWTERRYT